MSEFLGRGWAFPIEPEDDEIALVEGETDIEQSIRLILSTAPGERVMRPEFGCGVHDYAFAALDSTRLTLIEDDVKDALVKWEPRIEVLDVSASVTDRRAGELTIDVDYQVQGSNNERNLVYPFYLEGA